MHDRIRVFVMDLLEKKSSMPSDFDDTNDYIKMGIVDSMAIIKFILELEHKFDIEFAETDIESDEFRSVQGLIALICRKIGYAERRDQQQ